MCDVNSAESYLQVISVNVSELSQIQKKEKERAKRYPLKPPPAANYTPVVKVCQLVLCYKNITVFYSVL